MRPHKVYAVLTLILSIPAFAERGAGHTQSSSSQTGSFQRPAEGAASSTISPFQAFVSPEIDPNRIRKTTVDRCFWERKPTLMIIASKEEDKSRSEKFMKQLGTYSVMESSLQSAKGVLGKGTDALGSLFGKMMNTPEKPTPEQEQPKTSQPTDLLNEMQLISVTDTRDIWDFAYGQGWSQARQQAHEKRPRAFDSNGNARGLFKGIKERAFLKQATPQVNSRVPEEVRKRFVPEALEATKIMNKNFRADQFRFGELMDPSQAESFFTQMGIASPEFQVVLLDTQGKVAKRFTGQKIDPITVADAYEKLLRDHKKTNPNPKKPDKACDSDGDGVIDAEDFCPGTKKNDLVYTTKDKGKLAQWAGCAAGQFKGSGAYEGDQDGDGVRDSKDRCPNTRAGDKVFPETDEKWAGCASGQTYSGHYVR